MINYNEFNKIITETNQEKKEKLIKNFFESIKNLESKEKEELLDKLNPVIFDGSRIYSGDAFVKTVRDLDDIEKFKRSMNQQVAEKKVDKIQTKQTFFSNRIVKRIVNTIAVIVLGASVLTAGLAISHSVKTENKYQDVQTKYEYTIAENENLRRENAEAREALLGEKVNDFENQNKSLTELIEEFKETSIKDRKKELQDTYKMVVDLFEENGLDLSGIYNEETGEYDVEKLNKQAQDFLNEVCEQAGKYEQLQEKISSTLDLMKIENKEKGGYMTIEDYDSLGSALDDIIKNKESYYNKELDSIKKAIDDEYQSIGLKDFSVDERFGGDIKSAIAGLGEGFASQINSECKSLDDVLNYIDGLNNKYGELEQARDQLQEKYDKVVEDYQKVIDEKTEDVVQSGTEKDEDETVITPVADDEKDEQNNAGHENTEAGRKNEQEEEKYQ